MTTSGSPAVHYPLGDNQGSGSHLTNSSGASVARQSYTAFGLPRDGSDWDGAVPGGDQTAIDGISRRGYTGHGMLGAMGLIHMNGRVQDAITGRFLSPDPTIPNPGFTQSYNRYAYVNNNPLSYIDPSGFSDENNTDCGDGAPCEELDGIRVTGTVIRGCRVMKGGCDYYIAPSPWQLDCIFTTACHMPEGGEEGVSLLGPLRLEHNAERLALKMKTLGRRDANGTSENQRGKPQDDVSRLRLVNLQVIELEPRDPPARPLLGALVVATPYATYEFEAWLGRVVLAHHHAMAWAIGRSSLVGASAVIGFSAGLPLNDKIQEFNLKHFGDTTGGALYELLHSRD